MQQTLRLRLVLGLHFVRSGDHPVQEAGDGRGRDASQGHGLNRPFQAVTKKLIRGSSGRPA